MLRTKRKDIGDQAHALSRWNTRTAGDVFLQNVVLNGTSEIVHVGALFFSGDDVHGQENHRWSVDGH